MKFVPVTLRVNAGPPATAVAGFNTAMVGAPTAKVEPGEVAPPGLCTVRLRLAALASEAVGIVAAMLVAVPAVTVNAFVPAYTVEPAAKPPAPPVPAMKFVPLTVTVVSGDPVGTAFGLTEVIAGPLTVKLLMADEQVLVFLTVTWTIPLEASWVPVTAAASEVALTYVVVSAAEPHITVEPETKFVPVTLRMNEALPATAVVALNDPMVGALTVKLPAVEEAVLVFLTVTCTIPEVASWALVTAAVSAVALT
jgi:hypothetical protein